LQTRVRRLSARRDLEAPEDGLQRADRDLVPPRSARHDPATALLASRRESRSFRPVGRGAAGRPSPRPPDELPGSALHARQPRGVVPRVHRPLRPGCARRLARGMVAPGVLMIVENMSAPTDPRVWAEARTLRDHGCRVSIVCPRGVVRDTSSYELIE